MYNSVSIDPGLVTLCEKVHLARNKYLPRVRILRVRTRSSLSVGFKRLTLGKTLNLPGDVD
jgi:hypothetical protein